MQLVLLMLFILSVVWAILQAAPSPTPRVIPSGFKLQDGYRTTITLSSNAAIQFWEKTVQGFTADGGEPIDETTMLNSRLTTRAPQSLLTNGPMTTHKVAYDPNVIVAIRASINVPCVVTITYPTHATDCYYGYLKSFKADPLEKGKQPEATIELVETDVDYANGFVEAGPVYTPASGTA